MSQIAAHLSVVNEAVADGLGLDLEEVEPDASLLEDLGAESIDLLDVLFRIERKSGIKITASDLADFLQGGISDDEFSDDDHIVLDAGLAHLEKVLPQFDRAQLSEPLEAEGVLGLFTVQNLVDLVTARGADAS